MGGWVANQRPPSDNQLGCTQKLEARFQKEDIPSVTSVELPASHQSPLAQPPEGHPERARPGLHEEPILPPEEWLDLQKDIVFANENASKGTIQYPNCASLDAWRKIGIDPDVVRAVCMDRIKWKPVHSLAKIDRAVRERWAQVQQTRARAAVALPAAKRGPAVLTEEQRTVIVKMYYEAGAWGHTGPSPDCTGCEAPVDVIDLPPLPSPNTWGALPVRRTVSSFPQRPDCAPVATAVLQ
jgi:hypothetical protein